MLGSKSKYFFQSAEALKLNRIKLITYLEINDYSQLEINVYCKVFDYFCINPSHYDGATIVKDLHDIQGLDLKAMLHDYECLIGANRNFKLWFKSAYNYYLNHFKLGNGNQLFRFIGLIILGIGFVPYCYFFTPKYYYKK